MELDFLYVPSVDMATDTTHWVSELGAHVVFAVEPWHVVVSLDR